MKLVSHNAHEQQVNLISTSANKPESERNFIRKNDSQFYNVIENAGGIPYQLIFGQVQGEGFYSHIGAGIEKLTGVDASEFTESVFMSMAQEIRPVDVSCDVSEIRRKFVAGELKSFRAEILLKTQNGDNRWLRDCSIPLRDELTGMVIGASGMYFDISLEKFSAENESCKVDETEHLKNSFLMNISHEVRTPLNAIVGFSSLLCEPEQLHEKKLEYARIINNSADHFLEVMDNILEISRLEAGMVTLNNHDIYPAQLINRVYQKFSREALTKGIRFIRVIPEEDFRLYADNYKLLQIMNNLVSNSIKFTSDGYVEFGFRIFDGYVEFFSKDTGTGIHEEHKSRIFDKFFQAESGLTRSYPGTGLGLTISNEYAKLMGATLGFSSGYGKGSTFILRLPLFSRSA